MEEIKDIVARNLVKCRKAAQLTQLQLAEKLNYSDKAVSKWERGESLPDIIVLCELAKLYGVTLDYLVTEHLDKKPALYGRDKKRNRAIITIMSCVLAWTVATVIFMVLRLVDLREDKMWLMFIWALPVTCILCLVFSCIWGRRLYRLISVSALIWTLALSLYLTLPFQGNWWAFVIAVFGQVLTVCWSFLTIKRNRKK